MAMLSWQFLRASVGTRPGPVCATKAPYRSVSIDLSFDSCEFTVLAPHPLPPYVTPRISIAVGPALPELVVLVEVENWLVVDEPGRM